MNNKNKSSIFLIGPMGAGKSTIGQALASALNKEFYDTDRVVQQRTGVDLSWVFDVEGEAGFCRREAKILGELVSMPNIVLSTGGGTIISAKNRSLLKENGIIIYLKTDLVQQMKRTRYNKRNRPELRTEKVKELLIELNEERGPLYEEIADFVFLTGRRSIKTIISEIQDALADNI